MTIKKYDIWLASNIFLFLLLNLYLRKEMFSAGDSDGFFIDLQATKSFSWGTMEYLLELVHILRFVVAYPFLWLFENGFHPVFESILLLGCMFPVLTAEFGGKKHLAQALFIYLPYFISYRSVLVACAIAYLFILLFSSKRSSYLLWASALFANLSSGVVMGWLLIVLVNRRELMQRFKLLWLLVAAMALSLSFSISQKLNFFSETAKTTDSANGAVEAFMRNTVIVSYQNQQYARLVTYCLAILLLFVIFLHGMMQARRSRSSLKFFVCSVPGLFMEGLSVMAFVIPILWFYLGIRPFKRRVAAD